MADLSIPKENPLRVFKSEVEKVQKQRDMENFLLQNRSDIQDIGSPFNVGTDAFQDFIATDTGAELLDVSIQLSDPTIVLNSYKQFLQSIGTVV